MQRPPRAAAWRSGADELFFGFEPTLRALMDRGDAKQSHPALPKGRVALRQLLSVLLGLFTENLDRVRTAVGTESLNFVRLLFRHVRSLIAKRDGQKLEGNAANRQPTGDQSGRATKLAVSLAAQCCHRKLRTVEALGDEALTRADAPPFLHQPDATE